MILNKYKEKFLYNVNLDIYFFLMYNKRKTKEIFNMIEKIIPDRISLTLPTVFGEELTFLEFCGKLRAKLNESIDVVNKNTSDIQNNANYISTLQEKTAKNIIDIEKNTAAISKNATDIQKNTSDIQQNTSKISADESEIQAIKTAFNALRADFLNKKVESLFAPVILNVENHGPRADINASVYVRISRIDWQGLGCLYAKINLSFSGATDAKTLKINSVQFGYRKAVDITSVSTSFTAKTDVINLPISVVGSLDIPVGTSDMSVTGINLLGMSIVAESLASSFSLDSIPTGIDIPCESLAFTSPGGGESDPKFVYTLKISEGNMDIFTTGVGSPAMTERSHIDIDFSSTISAPNIYDQFLCVGGVYDDDSISSISANGVSLGAALINYTEYTDNNHTYTARISIKNIYDGGSSFTIKPTGVGTQPTPFGKFSHTSLAFEMLNY